MIPEISHRCLGCGAAVRARARFCPQCGRQVGDEAEAVRDEAERASEAVAWTHPEPPPTAEAGEPGDPLQLDESWKRWEQSLGARGAHGGAEEVAKDEAAKDEAALSVEVETSGAPPAPAPLPSETRESGEVGARLVEGKVEGARATHGGAEPVGPLARPMAEAKGRRAAAVRETLRPRVEKVRDASVGVFEDAAEDSGLRFVLIAVLLFLLFLLLLFFNQMLK